MDNLTLTEDTTQQEIAALHRKLDYLTELLENQRQQQAARDELFGDMLPIVNDFVKLTINELDEVGNDFELDDILYLGKRLLRDTRLLTTMLDQLESVAELTQDMKFITTPAFNNLIEILAQLEQKGYFKFLNGLLYVSDKVVTEFDEDDVRALGDNIVTILTTVRNLTQPEIMALANTLIHNIEAPVDDNVSTWALIREMRNPDTRKGLARLLNVVKGLAVEGETTANNN